MRRLAAAAASLCHVFRMPADLVRAPGPCRCAKDGSDTCESCNLFTGKTDAGGCVHVSRGLRAGGRQGRGDALGCGQPTAARTPTTLLCSAT